MVKQINDTDVEIHDCTFQGFFIKAKLNLRFPCSFFIEWRSLNGKQLNLSVNKYKAKNGVVQFNESLCFTTEMLWDKRQQNYLKKDSIIKVNLVSASRPDQIKLVGQLNFDLAEVLNYGTKRIQGCRKLSYCSVDAELMFDIKVNEIRKSEKLLGELDKSTFNMQSYSIQPCSKVNDRQRSRSQESSRIIERVKSESRLREKEINVSPLNLLNSSSSQQLRNDFIVIEQDHSRSPSTFIDDSRKIVVQQSVSPVKETQPIVNSLNQNRQEQIISTPRSEKPLSSWEQTVGNESKSDYSPRQIVSQRSTQQFGQKNRNNYDQIIEQNLNLKRQFTRYETKIQILEQRMKSLMKQLEDSKVRRQVEKIENDSKAKALLQTKINDIESKLKYKDSELAIKYNEVSQLNKKLDNFSKQVNKRQQELQEFKIKSTQLQIRLQEAQNFNEKLQREKDQQIFRLQQSLKNANQLVQQIQNKSNKTTESGFLLEVRLKELQSKVQQSQILRNQLQNQISACQQTLRQKDQDILMKEERIKRLQEQLNTKDERLFHFQGLYSEYETIKQQKQQEANFLNVQIQMMEKQNIEKINDFEVRIKDIQQAYLLIEQEKLQLQKIVAQSTSFGVALTPKQKLQLQLKVQTLSNQNQVLLKQNEQLLSKSNQQQVTQLNEENFKLHMQILELQELVEQDKSKQKQKQNQKNSNLIESILKGQIAQLERENEDLINQTLTFKQENQVLKHKLLQIQIRSHDSIQQEKKEHLPIDNDKKTDSKTIEQKYKKQYDSMVNQYEKQIQTLKDEFQQYTKDIQVYKSQLSAEYKKKLEDNKVQQLINNESIERKEQNNQQSNQVFSQLDQPNACLEKLVSKQSQFDELTSSHNEALERIKEYEIKISFLQAQLTKSKEQIDLMAVNQVCPQMKQIEYKQADEYEQYDLQNDHHNRHNMGLPGNHNNRDEDNHSRLDIKIKVNEVQSIDQSHHSQDHQYVLTEEDYLPHKVCFKMAKGEDAKSFDDMDIINRETQDEDKNRMARSQVDNYNHSTNYDNEVSNNGHNNHKNDKKRMISIDQVEQMISEINHSQQSIRESAINVNEHYEQKLIKIIELQQRILSLQALNRSLVSQVHQKQTKQRQLQDLLSKFNENIENHNERQQNNLESLYGRISELEEDLKLKDEILAEMEGNVQQAYELKFQLAEILEVKKDLENMLKLKEEKVNELEEIVLQLNKNIQDNHHRLTASNQQIQNQQTHNMKNVMSSGNTKESKSIDLEKSQQMRQQTQTLRQQNESLKLQLQQKLPLLQEQIIFLQDLNNQLKQQNTLLNEDMKLARQQILQVQEQSLNYKELVLKMQQELNDIKEKNNLLETQAHKLLEKSVVLEEDNLMFKQQLQLHEHSSDMRYRKNSLSLSSTNKQAQLDLPQIQQIPQKNESEYQTQFKESIKNGSDIASKQENADQNNKYQQKFHYEASNGQQQIKPNSVKEEDQSGFIKKKRDDQEIVQQQILQATPLDINGNNLQYNKDRELLLQDLRTQLQILRQELINESNEHTLLKQSRQRLLSENQNLKLEKQQLNEDLSLTKNELKETKTNKEFLQAKIKQVQHEMKKIMKDFDEYREVYQNEINNWIISKEQSYTKSKNSNQNSQALIQKQDSRQQKASSSSQSNDKHKQQISLRDQQLSKLKQENQYLTLNLKEAQQRSSYLERQIESSSQKIADMKGENTQNHSLLQQQVDKLSSSNRNLQETINQQSVTISSLKQTLQKDQLTLQQQSHQLHTCRLTIQQLNDRIFQIEEKNLVLQKQKSDLFDNATGVETLIKQSQDEINKLKESIFNRETEVEKLTRQKGETSKELQVKMDQNKHLHEKIQELLKNQESGVEQMAQFKKIIQQLSQQVDVQKNKNKNLVKEIQILRNDLEKAKSLQLLQEQQINDQIQTRERQLLSQLSQKEQLNNHLQMNAISLSSKIDKLQLQLSHSSQQLSSSKQREIDLLTKNQSLFKLNAELTSKLQETKLLLLEVEEHSLKQASTFQTLNKKNSHLLSVVEKQQRKQLVTKEYLLTLQQQSKSIFAIVKQKQIQTEEMYKVINELQEENASSRREISKLQEIVSTKDNLLNYYENYISLQKIIPSNQPIVTNINSDSSIPSSNLNMQIQNNNINSNKEAFSKFNSPKRNEVTSPLSNRYSRTPYHQSSRISQQTHFSCKEFSQHNAAPNNKDFNLQSNDLTRDQQMNLLILKNQELLNKNKEFLQVISKKASISVQNEKLRREFEKQELQIRLLKEEHQRLKLDSEKAIGQRNQQLISLEKEKNKINDQLKILKVKLSNLNSCSVNILADLSKTDESVQNGSSTSVFARLLEQKNKLLELSRKSFNSLQSQLNKIKQDQERLIEQNFALLDNLKQKQHVELQLKSKINQLELQASLGATKTHQILQSPKSVPSQGFTKTNLSNQNFSNKPDSPLAKLSLIVGELNSISSSKLQSKDRQNLLRILLQKNVSFEQSMNEYMSQNHNKMKEKARTISKEIQRIKSAILKGHAVNMEEKTKIVSIMRNCQNIVLELISITESINDNDCSISNNI